jgi:hypothetical protein
MNATQLAIRPRLRLCIALTIAEDLQLLLNRTVFKEAKADPHVRWCGGAVSNGGGFRISSAHGISPLVKRRHDRCKDDHSPDILRSSNLQVYQIEEPFHLVSTEVVRTALSLHVPRQAMYTHQLAQEC